MSGSIKPSVDGWGLNVKIGPENQQQFQLLEGLLHSQTSPDMILTLPHCWAVAMLTAKMALDRVSEMMPLLNYMLPCDIVGKIEIHITIVNICPLGLLYIFLSVLMSN